jgi:hypothetical protein
MDTGTGRIYPNKEDAMKAGVPEKRLVQGSMPSLRKMKKMIQKQMRREGERRYGRGGSRDVTRTKFY